ncbi:hypothetical protein CICLE_v10010247mg [Citrus x clementina]|uniref:Uncharacterized protein n=2 Tax=Citrus TaxID=2706 RepID=V4WFK9_CITCL|nr:hypothetical protein CICLE_v10010247mg [Citrus x clementina]GAY31788.1 hypothetical protein CUMW_287970 [Citrus unshiu]
MLVKFRNLIPESCSKRMCPGLSFGYLPLAKCSTTFDWKLHDGKNNEDLVLTEAFGVTLRTKGDLFLSPYSRL